MEVQYTLQYLVAAAALSVGVRYVQIRKKYRLLRYRIVKYFEIMRVSGENIDSSTVEMTHFKSVQEFPVPVLSVFVLILI